METVIIIGAGAAGLTAANELSLRGIPVVVIEANRRAGGRIRTTRSATGNLPIELGAEFIHGVPHELWQMILAEGLQVHEVPDRHWQFANGKLSERENFWSELSGVGAELKQSGPDMDVRSWLERKHNLSARAKELALNFVEGFHAATADRMSVRAWARANAESDEQEGRRAFRIQNGYQEIPRVMMARLRPRNVWIYFNAVAKSVRWEPGAVEVEAECSGVTRIFRAARVIVTVPLGVLKSEHRGIVFEPALVEKEEAISGLEMGHVVKVTLQFRLRFWHLENFGFVHAANEWLPTWWADERGLILTGWAGGPKAGRLGEESDDAIVEEAIRALSRIFGVEQQRVRDQLVESWRHDWSRDPFARGAYSYTPVGMLDMPQRLGEPVANTIYFAGEATAKSGEQGTVHAAIASGKRAAREILENTRTHFAVPQIARV
ncbi:MAG TPA: NAD(P)/FAD-dependent oxidoreductase [Verrucomicrobiae bacterium]|nr:NAD(P)/FAD-dependent oxidoreductase [Verrucomicrobiae bacterium]